MTDSLKQILAELKQRLEELYGDRLARVILYGSQARGDAEPDSDIDILVVLKGTFIATQEQERVSFITSELGIKHQVLIATLILNEAQYNMRQYSFIRNVHADGINL